jgi:polycomb protein EED
VLTKSVDCHVTLWQPEDAPYAEGGHVREISVAELEDSDLWFIRFGLDVQSKIMACGNRVGCVRVWDMTAHPPRLLAQLRARHAVAKGAAASGKAAAARARAALPVRQAAPSADGRIVLAACEDGTIWRWDRRPESGEDGEEAAAGAAGASGHER